MVKKDLKKPLINFVTKTGATISVDETVSEAINTLRGKHISDGIVYIYVVDNTNALVGVVSTRNLILSEGDVTIFDIMNKTPLSLSCEKTLQEALEFLESHHLLAIPVVNSANILMGVIDVGLYLEDKIDVTSAKRRSDIFQMIGIYVEDGRGFKIFKKFRSRLAWILCNILGGLTCATISHHFEHLLSQVVMLAMFIPLVLTLSESISMQSMTQAITWAGRGRKSWRALAWLLFKEWRIVGLIAISAGLIVGIISLLWGNGGYPSIAISCSILISTCLTSIVGSVVPLILHANKWDPCIAAGPIVLSVADVLTTTLYLYIGSIIMKQ